MLTQIWSAPTDVIFCHFRPFFALLPHCWLWKLKFGKNVKKHLEILSFDTRMPFIKIICTPDMIYGSWDMKFNRQNCFVILLNFLPFHPLPHHYPLTVRKMKVTKMKKNPRDIIILYKCKKNHDYPLYCSRDAVPDRCNCDFHFRLYFSLLPH